MAQFKVQGDSVLNQIAEVKGPDGMTVLH